MKRYIVLIILLALNLTTFAQDLFNVGLEYFAKGQYSQADSIFSICMKEPNPDPNLMFNYATTRFYLQDTSKFCDIMWRLGHKFQDADANALYFKICGTADTTFFDKDFNKCDKDKARYTEILEVRKHRDFGICYLHDKRSKGKSMILNPADLNHIQTTDIVAQYKLFNDGTKLYLFTLTPPKYIDGFDARRDYIDKNPYAKEAKDKLQVNKLVVYVKYILERSGNIKNIEITGTNKPVEKMEQLKNYVDLIIAYMPRQSPGQFRDENVDFEIEDSISIW